MQMRKLSFLPSDNEKNCRCRKNPPTFSQRLARRRRRFHRPRLRKRHELIKYFSENFSPNLWTVLSKILKSKGNFCELKTKQCGSSSSNFPLRLKSPTNQCKKQIIKAIKLAGVCGIKLAKCC